MILSWISLLWLMSELKWDKSSNEKFPLKKNLFWHFWQFLSIQCFLLVCRLQQITFIAIAITLDTVGNAKFVLPSHLLKWRKKMYLFWLCYWDFVFSILVAANVTWSAIVLNVYNTQFADGVVVRSIIDALQP